MGSLPLRKNSATRALFEPEELAGIVATPAPPFGIFTLVRLRN